MEENSRRNENEESMESEKHAAETPADEPKDSCFDYDSVVNRCMGDTVLANRLMSKLAERIEDDLLKIGATLTEGKPDEMASLAHKLKGAAANLEVKSVEILAKRLEHIGRSGDLAQAPAILSDLERSAEVYRVEVAALPQQGGEE